MKYDIEQMPQKPRASRRRASRKVNPELAEIVSKVFVLGPDERMKVAVPVDPDDGRFANNGRTRYERSRTLDRVQKSLRDAADQHDPAFKLHIKINENPDTGKIVREPDGTVFIWIRPGKTRTQLATEKASKENQR